MKTCVQILATLLCMVLGANSLHAATTYTWSNLSGGVWSTTGNWTGGLVGDGAGNFANFNTLNITADRTVTLDANRTIGTIQFGDTSGNNLWTLSGVGVLTMDNTGGSGAPLIRAVQDSFNCSVVLAGTSGIRGPQASPPAVVLLNAANTYTGDTEVSRNIIRIGNVNALPSMTSNGRSGNVVFVFVNAQQSTLDLNAKTITINGLSSDTVNGALGTVTSGAAGAITLTLGDNNQTTTFAGVIQNGSGTVGLTKIGTGTQTFTGVNTYTRPTTISAGTLTLSGSGALSGTSAINLAGGATFDVSGVTATPYTIATGKTLNGSGGTGTINGSVTLASGALLTLTHALGTPTLTVPSGTLTLNGNATTVTVSGYVTTAGSPYKLISVSGSGVVAGTTGPLTLLGAGVGDGGTPSLQIIGNELYLVVTGGGPLAEWGPADGTWEVGIAGWGSTGATLWANGDAAQLTDTYSTGNPAIALNTEVLPTGVLMSSTNTWTISGTGDIGGTAGLRMIGPGTLTMDVPNVYTGGTELTGGTLNIRNASALGASGTLTINGGTLDNTSAGLLTTPNYTQAWNGNFAFGGTADLDLGTGAVTMSAARTVTVNGTKTLTVGGAISGTGFGLTKAGTGALALGGNNLFTGTVTINLGEIILNNAGALNSTTPNTVTFAADANVKTLSLNGNNLTVTNLSGGSAVVTFANTKVRNNHASTPATLTIGVASGTQTFIGTLQNGGAAALSVTKVGAGVWAFGGGGSFGSGTYTGDTTISAGTLRVAANNLLPTGIGRGNVIVNATLDMNDKNVSINGLSGSGTVTASVASIANALSVGGGNATAEFTGVINNGSSISPFVSLTKIGTGTQTLSGVNTYSGPTLVSAGTLTGKTGGSCANSAVSVDLAATLNVQYTGANAKWRAASLTFPGTATSPKLNFDLGANQPSTTVAPLELSSGVTFSVTPTINITGPVIADGGYPLIKYTTSNLGTMPTTATLPAGSSAATLVDDTASGTIWLWVGSAAPIHWATGPGAWDLMAPNNWMDPASAFTTYADGMAVQFLDLNATGNPVVTLGTAVTPAVVLASPATITYTLTGLGAINGGATLTKSGAGTLILDLANGYTGGSVLSGGTLSLKQAAALGNISGTFTINGGTLDNALGSPLALNSYPQAWNGDFTYAGTTSALDLGAGAVTLGGTRTVTVTANTLTVGGDIAATSSGLIKAGAGTLALGGNNAFTGGATINLGEILIKNAGALNSTAPNVFKFALDTSIKTLSLNGNSLTVTNLQGGQAVAGSLNTQVRNNHASTPATLTVSVPSGTITYIGLIADGSTAGLALTKTGAGVWFCGAGGGLINSSFTYSLDTTISGGTLRVGNNSLFPSGAGKGNVINNATLDMNDRNIVINGLSGSGTVTATANSIANVLTLGGGDASGSFSGVINNGSSVSPFVSLVKNGAGTQRLSGTLAYTGATTVNGGALVVNSPGSTASGSAVTVAATATLGGSGTIKGTTTVNGILAPGVDAAAAGTTLAVTATTLTLPSTCVISNRINKVGVTLTADKVNKTGNLALAGTLKVVLDPGASPLALNDTFDLFDGTITANTLTYNLPSLPAGLAWDTTGLNAGGNGTIKVKCDGTLAVSAAGSQTICSGGSANLTSTPSGGAPGYSYLWSPGGATTQNPTVSPTSTTTYTVTVTDANGCTAVSSGVTVTVNTVPVASAPTVNSPVCSGSPAIFSVSATGGDLSYVWRKVGAGWGSGNQWQLANGANSGFFVGTSSVNGGGASSNIDTSGKSWGMYANSGDTASAVRGLGAGLSVGQTIQLDMDNGWIEAGGTVGFGLRNSAGENVWEFYYANGSPSYTINELAGATATGIGFTADGLRIAFTLTSATTFSVTVITAPLGTPTSYGPFTGSLLSPSGGQAIAQLRLFNSNAGSFSDRDAFFNSILIGAYSDNAASYSGWTNGDNLGNGPISGANGSTYTINSPTVGDSGSYDVFVSNACGQSTSSSVSLTVNPLPIVTEDTGSHVNVTPCSGDSNGQIVLNAATGGSGTGYTYSKDGLNYQVSTTFSGLMAGTYQMTAKDSLGCISASVPVIITQPTVVAVTEAIGSHVNVTCNGGSDGVIVLNAATGGSGAGYQYSSDGGTTWQAGTTFNGLTAATYQMKAKDGNGCLSANVPVIITQPAAVAVTENTGAHVNVACNGGNNGQIVLNTATGGSGAGYEYSSDGGATWQAGTTFSGLTANTYQMKAKDGNGCLSANTPVIITEPAAVPNPVFQSINLVGPDVVLVWSSVAGQKYRVQCTANLTPTITWTDLTGPASVPLVPDVTAPGLTSTYTDAAAPAPRYYRILVVCP